MGGSTSVPQVLPQIWQRINESHLRHRHTLEIIEEHHLRSHTQEQHGAVLAALGKRIALHHPAVPILIYFRQTQEEGLCSALGSDYSVVLYSEYRGDSLQRVVEQKGERVYHSPCQCLQILGAVQYLRDHYGCFAVTPQMIFLGSRKERIGKVWLHSRIEESQPQFPSNEQDMCLSLWKLFFFMRSQRICMAVTHQQLQAASGITQLSELKNYLVSLHRQSMDAPEGMAQRKKANSQSSSVRQDAGLHYFSQRPEKSQNQTNVPLQKNSVSVKPKIKFVYCTQNAAPQPITSIALHQQSNQTKLPAQVKHQRSQSYGFSPVAIQPPSQQVSQLNSIAVSPESRSQDKQSNFTSREIALPLKEMEEKGTSSRLPTTSRSPKRPKELVFNPIQEVPEINERKFASQENKPRRRIEKTVSLHSSGNKFEKYRDAIRNYEQKLRQKFANSTGSNPLTAKRKTDLVLRPPVTTPSPTKLSPTQNASKGQYKETESLYNSSENEEKQTSLANHKNIQEASKQPQDRGESLRDLQLTNEHSQDQERQNKRLREHLEKIELEKDLQREKAIINSEMQDLLRQSGTKDEYRSIRDKIKQKKETFAQLKAEAAKILEDLDY